MNRRRSATDTAHLNRRGEAKLLRGRPAFERLILLAIVFMPFQYALTISIGFPLKISEVLAALGIAAYLLGPSRRRIRPDFATLLVVLLMVALTFSAVANFAPVEIIGAAIGYGRGMRQDLILYAAFAVFAVAFWAVARRVDRILLIRAVIASIWTCGAAVLLQWAASITGSAGVIAALGFRTAGVGGDTGSLRSGPFLEGQHLGFFAGAALIVAIYRRSWAAAAVAVASILYSESTTAYVGLAVGVLLLIILRPHARVLIPAAAIALVGTIVVLVWEPVRETLGRQLAKLGFTEFAPDYLYATTSINIRSAKAEIAFRMMGDNPWFGVGPGRFGAHFGEYANDYTLPWVYYTGVTRPIAENAYGHVAAELGVLALIVFVALIIYVVIRNRVEPPVFVILAGYIAVSIATQSSWTFMPIWVFLAILCARPDAVPRELGSVGGFERDVPVGGDAGRSNALEAAAVRR